MSTRTIDLIKNETRDIKWIVDKLRAGELIVDNSFQRNYVWLKKHQIRLIETVLLGYTIPEIYLWTIKTDPDNGQTTYSIVDGQQRIGAVYKYICGKFKLEKKYVDNKEAAYVNKYFKELSNEEKSCIWEYPFSVRFIKHEVKKADIIAMFLRLNSTNTSLNPQELRNAEFDGEFLRLAEEIAQNEFWSKWDIFSKNQIRRMADIQFISTLLIFLRFGIEEETTQTNINKIYDMFNETYEERDKDKRTVEKVLSEMENIMINDRIINFVRKTTHMYILFIITYMVLKQGRAFDAQLIEKLDTFVKYYDNNEELNKIYDSDTVMEIQEYKKLSSEGTQSKSKKLRRLEIFMNILGL